MKIIELLVFMMIGSLAMIFITDITFIQGVLEQRNVNKGEFQEFGILMFALTLVITFVVQLTKK